MLTRPYCDSCGVRRDEGDHARCDLMRAHEPPRWCPGCCRRMVVQVTPGGWTARCIEHGNTIG